MTSSNALVRSSNGVSSYAEALFLLTAHYGVPRREIADLQYGWELDRLPSNFPKGGVARMPKHELDRYITAVRLVRDKRDHVRYRAPSGRMNISIKLWSVLRIDELGVHFQGVRR